MMRSNKEQVVRLRRVGGINIVLVLLAYAIPMKSVVESASHPQKLQREHRGVDNADKYFTSLSRAGPNKNPSIAEVDATKNGVVKLLGVPVHDVTKYGAKGNGQPNLSEEEGEVSDLNALAFLQAWRKACETAGPVIVKIPPGKYVVGQVTFSGPCNSSLIKVENEGTLLANTDLSLYPSAEWILFERVQYVIFTGSGEIDAQGPKMWKYNNCKQNAHCGPLPTSLRLFGVNNSMIHGITSKDSMFFHMSVGESENVTIRGVRLTAPAKSPNTDGIHTSRSRHIKICNSFIGTGDDCISMGQGSIDISVNNITCGPGHGISVGSLGKESSEQHVRGIRVRNCTLNNTTNGVRIKTYAGSVDTMAQHILFQDIVMNHVKHPIIIDATYTNAGHGVGKGPSHVKLSNIHFRNIRGTSSKEDIVTLNCSHAVPCDGIRLQGIHVTPPPGKKAMMSCMNAKVQAVGVTGGLVCH